MTASSANYQVINENFHRRDKVHVSKQLQVIHVKVHAKYVDRYRFLNHCNSYTYTARRGTVHDE